MQTISSRVDVDYITNALALCWLQRKKWKHAHRALHPRRLSIQIHKLASKSFLLCKGVCIIKQITLQPQPSIKPTRLPSQWGLSCSNIWSSLFFLRLPFQPASINRSFSPNNLLAGLPAITKLSLGFSLFSSCSYIKLIIFLVSLLSLPTFRTGMFM